MVERAAEKNLPAFDNETNNHRRNNATIFDIGITIHVTLYLLSHCATLAAPKKGRKVMRRTICLIAICLSGCGGSTVTPNTGTSIATPTPRTDEIVVFIGDSLTQGWGPEGLYGTPIANPTLDHLVPGSINAGISGQTSDQMLARFNTDVLSHHPAVVVIGAGTNDLRFDPNATVDNVATMAEEASSAGARVVITTVLPSALWTASTVMTQSEDLPDIQRFNHDLRLLTQTYGYTFVDYYDEMLNPDGSENTTLFIQDEIHPNEAGYSVMWSVLHPELVSLGVH